MHIISKVRDYYDSGAMYGVDKSVVYERHPTVIERSHPWYKTLQGKINLPYTNFSNATIIRYNATPDHKGRHRAFRSIPYTKQAISIIVAGKEYYGYLVEYSSSGINPEDKHHFFWYARDFLDWIKDHIPEECYNEEELLEINNSSNRFRKDDRNFSSSMISERFRSFMLENRIVSITTDIRKSHRSCDLMINSDNLVLYKLQKIVSADQMFQEIDQWISMMNDPSRKMVEVSNDIKIAKHGLDKWSFRKKAAS